jgi:hypothetical protein
MAMPANSGWLDQCEEGNAAGGHASEVEVLPYPAVSSSIAAAHDLDRPATDGLVDHFPFRKSPEHQIGDLIDLEAVSH